MANETFTFSSSDATEQKMGLSLDEIIKEKSREAKEKRNERKKTGGKTKAGVASAGKGAKSKTKAKLASVQRNAKLAEKRQMGAKAIASATKQARNPAKIKVLSGKKKKSTAAIKSPAQNGKVNAKGAKIKSKLIDVKKKKAAALNGKKNVGKSPLDKLAKQPMKISIQNTKTKKQPQMKKTPPAKGATPATARARKVVMPGTAAAASKAIRGNMATQRQNSARGKALASKRGLLSKAGSPAVVKPTPPTSKVKQASLNKRFSSKSNGTPKASGKPKSNGKPRKK